MERPEEAAEESVAVRTRGLGRRYGRRWVVRGLDLAVPRGAVYGMLGLNGAGKSTTLRMLMGLIRRGEGEALVLGLDPARRGVELKRRVGYVPDDPALYEWMTVHELCGFAGHYHGGRWKPQRALELMARFKLPLDTKLKHLSKGQRAKTLLVLALAFDPEMLILDEPTTGLDPVARREFIEGVLGEFQQEGKTIVISSHLVNELAGLVDHVGVLHEGRLIFSGPVEEFLGSVRRVRMSFGGEAPAAVQCTGLLRAEANGHDMRLSVRDFDEARVRGELAEYSPEAVEIETLGLEDAFVEFVGGAEGVAR